MGELIAIFIGSVIAVVGEGVIANAVSGAGISGIAGTLLTWALPGALLLYFLTKVLALKES